MKQKILLTAIVSGDKEAKMFQRMLESFMPFMAGLAVNINGQGKKHKIKKLIRKYKGKYIDSTPETHPEQYTKMEDGSYLFSNFAAARDVSFKLAEEMQKKENYDWWSWADTDDLLVSGEELQNAAERAQELKLDEVMFTYWYSVNVKADGTFSQNDVVIDHLRERLLKPGLWKWVSRLHEVALPKDDNFKPNISLYDFNMEEERTCVWAHITDKERIDKAIERNIKILEIQAREEQEKTGQQDPRTTFYLAKSYYDSGKKEYLQLSELLLHDYLDRSGWAEERSSAWEYLAQIKTKQNDHKGAIDCLHMAVKEGPVRHMPYLLLAKEYAEIGQITESNHWLSVVMAMEEPKARTTLGSPLNVKFMAALLKYNEAIRNNNITEAIYWLKKRNELSGLPDDGMIKTLEDAKLMNDAAMWVFNYCKWLKDKGHSDLIPKILDGIAPEFKHEAFVQIMNNEFREPKKWGEKDIVFYGSWGAPHFESWDENNLKKGIGGSETAIIELSKYWAKDGWNVTVFCETPENHDTPEGVHYRHWSEINWKDEFNILILWRSPHLLDKDIKAKHLFMDLHDIASQLDWTEPRMQKIDKVFFKSNWHRSHIPKLPDEKAVVISNGI